MSLSSCCKKGPGYASPLEAMQNGPREKLLYVAMIPCQEDQPNYIATIDIDPNSSNYQQVISRLYVPNINDELHHFGWNACSSCHDDCDKQRRFIILGGFKSSRIYIVDTADETQPTLHKIIESDELKKLDLSAPHTVHCLGSGEIMISCLGNAKGELPGGFLLLNQNFEVTGRWMDEANPSAVQLYYDFWYKPRYNIMISSEWAAPNVFSKSFNPNDVALNKYGHSLHFWDWSKRKYLKSIDLGSDGAIPLELRFCHNPATPYGYVVCALGSSVFRYFPDASNEWQVEKTIQVEALTGKDGQPVPAIISDMLISLNDKFIYFCNWLHGDIRQYDISDPSKPKLTGQIWLGGLIKTDNDFEDSRSLTGGPQMIQLSLDGKRLYVTNSLFSSWDDQFYPAIKTDGSYLVKIDCDSENGGMKLDQKFYISFKNEPNGPSRAHEMRYPGGDATSDIWN
ncbi:unnamed protein product [Rotaria magnacalcarata]|uniref:Methanethiol oxidase n=1 Tax=Rotaria magnacalcarata TaxID=392030 RepID=A0A819FV99_9BILA|nr:unnamed protein product [Rotaria magnacalcarata]CAF1365732.1 unnamed protein product [Rotaria magnacalcarata]CAF2117208.1 unnamed protein product [Rotaria magnacalcarata]CAF2123037.1 unnamed protein product [Rotaria magnacalcarata]CAF2132884.1 unnamed protein product [Rotaria magnacalcarata]